MDMKENISPASNEHRGFKFEIQKPNRRHTLVPTHSILKPSIDSNNTIVIIPSNKIEKRRVSFAPEVTLHKITHYSRYLLKAHASDRRNSLPPLHSYSQERRVGKSSLKNVIVADGENSSLFEGNVSDEVESNDEDYSQKVSKVRPVAIDEDTSTQTMELSTDLTNQLQSLPSPHQNMECVDPKICASNGSAKELNAKDVFQEAVRDLQKSDLGRKSFGVSDSEQTMDFTSAFGDDRLSIVFDNETKTMEMESRRGTLNSILSGGIDEVDETKTMELTGPIPKLPSSGKTIGSERSPVGPSKRSLVMKGVEYDQGHVSKTMRLGMPSCDAISSAEPKPITDEEKIPPAMLQAGFNSANVSLGDISYSEQLSTEMIPLAEISSESIEEPHEKSQITVESEEGMVEDDEEYDEDDDYENVTLPTFLDEVHVQFFDGIGPSDRELTADVDENHKATLIEYVKAANNIPEFRYFEHLIKQYRNSIKSIHAIVEDFEQNVKENNPTSIREYYEQTDVLRRDLKINYQALASYTRQQAKQENLSYLINLLDQLKKSYEDSSSLLDVQLEKVIEIRKRILLRQQELIEQKSELSISIAKIKSEAANLSDNDRVRSKDFMVHINAYIAEKRRLESKIEELGKVQEIKVAAVNAQQRSINHLKDEVEDLQLNVQHMKVPTEAEIEEKQKELEMLETKSQIRFASLDEKLCRIVIMNEVEITIDLENNKKRLAILYKNEKLAHLLHNQQVCMEQISYRSLKEYITKLKQVWTKFKMLVRDVTLMKMRYQSIETGNYLKDGIIIYRPGQYKMELSYKPEDLLRFHEPVKVDVNLLLLDDARNMDASTVLAIEMARSKLNLATMKRFIVK
ncbi:hypothetical protein FOA43_001384 [Brettanomyces nanus]|uniref:Spc7 kinetochore protein domain-containing protein n=1 Tax=Eeniella nana TaxID=13502 RepID=A0A875RZH7_EENNA|nr:uncharacterized protein FOA43_001384 [Brettanomyces nanus]QPG74063.1 hypothetical protein FOA43_001384 [Brettanomyces nanus]